MPRDAQHYHSQQFEHIIATIFTCRSVLKYNLTLSAEQKSELLVDIDTSLEALRSHLIAPHVIEPEDRKPDAPFMPSDLHLASETDALPSGGVQAGPASEKQTLHALYRMYHAYLDEEQGPNVYTFMKRFNEVMSTINDVQQHIHPGHDLYVQQDPIERSLERLQAFVSDLYYIFMEFIRVLSDLLQQNNVSLSTEELSSLHAAGLSQEQREQKEQPEQKLAQRDLVLLLEVYTTHQQLDKLKGHLAGRVREITAFLDVLKQNASNVANGRQELIVRLNQTTSLLDDMARLLLEYEKVASTLL
ncbi:MAG: hypothetical protein NVSMB44_37790 [Ktedonobacteraceae bacterium]